MVAMVDDEDVWLTQWKWFARKGFTGFYGCRSKAPQIHMHREILQAPDGMDVDHKDGNGLNNVRSNLRLATRSQNQCNKPMYKTNTSGYKGVTWDKSRGQWMAKIKVGPKHINLGRFDDITDAAAAYAEAALKYHGDFAHV
jgi:HNH endonuclease/AP2 domain